jgi:hypothetical protein
MKNLTYNGWTNYATWRVSLEIFDGYDFEDLNPQEITATFCEEWVEECIFNNFDTCNTPMLIEDYARAFLRDVNYYEIAKHIRESIEEINEFKNKNNDN